MNPFDKTKYDAVQSFLMVQIMVHFTIALATFGLGGQPIITLAILSSMSLALSGYTRFVKPRRKHKDDVPLAEPPSKDPTWCSDCGKRFVLFSGQNGFDPKTGEPHLETRMACPDYDAAKATRAYSAAVGSSGPLFGWPHFERFLCGNKTTTNAKAVEHSHPLGEVDVNCVRCLVDMEAAGVISRTDASIRIANLS